MNFERGELVDITLHTRAPDKWLVLDLETGQAWKWVDGQFQRAWFFVDLDAVLSKMPQESEQEGN